MQELSDIDKFWNRYLQALPQTEPIKRYYEAFSFGYTLESANLLSRLVLEGTKTATSMLLWELEAQQKPLWHVGDASIVLDGNGIAVGIIETIELKVQPFNSVDAQFAHDYGEGDQTLTWWHTEMWDSYVEVCQKLGRLAAQDMPLVCERFKLIFR
jgi:uncharacterized protein YhfF